MSRRNAYIIFSIVLGLIIALLIFLLFIFSKSNGQYQYTNSFASSIRDFFPFGKTPTTPFPVQTASTTETNVPVPVSSSTAVIPRLRQISTAPIAGDTVFDKKISVVQDNVQKTINEQQIRFVDRATGHVFETSKDNLGVTELSNTTIPKIYEAHFSANPNIFIIRFLNDQSDQIITKEAVLGSSTPPLVASSTASTTATTPTASISPGTPLITTANQLSPITQYLAELAVAPQSNRLIYSSIVGSKGIFSIANLDGSKAGQLFSSPLTQWLLDWPNEGTAVITTKASGIANGISLLLNTKTGGISKVASGNGLTTLVSPDVSAALVGRGGDTPTLFVDNLKGGEINLSLQTLPEKCVWGKSEAHTVYCFVPQTIPSGTYPDNWYQGILSFSDNIWKIDTSTGISTVVALLGPGYGQTIDAVDPHISSDDSYLTFTDKSSLLLWGFRIRDTASSTVPVTPPATASSTTKTTPAAAKTVPTATTTTVF